MRRAGYLARGRAALANTEGPGDRLRILLENGLAFGQALVVFIGQGDGADLDALAATGAFLQIDETGLLVDGSGKVSRVPFEIQKFSIGEQFDIQMPADLDQFGGNNSHRTIVGGKRLVQLGHEPPDRRRFFHEVDIVTRFCQIKCRLHAGDTGAYYHY
jgi:hypothetical protein